jgi:hypothetical protein
MKIENCKNGQKVLAKGKKGTVLFTCYDSFTGKKPMIRVMTDEMFEKQKSGYNGENFNPDDIVPQ